MSIRYHILGAAAILAAFLFGLDANAADSYADPAGLFDGVNHAEEVEGPAQGQPVPAKEARKAEAAAPEVGAQPDPLAERIAALTRQIADLKAKQRKDTAPVDLLKPAAQTVRALREERDALRAELEAADREAEKKAAARAAQFDKTWSDFLKLVYKGVSLDDLRTGTPPRNVDPVLWADLRDRFSSERLDLEAELAELRQVPSAASRRRLQEMNDRAQAAEAWLKARQQLDAQLQGDARNAFQQEMAYRAHLLAIANAQRELIELEQIQAEHKGQRSEREDPLAKEMYKGTGLWMSDALNNQVLREMNLADCGYPRKGRPDEAEPVLDHPDDWMGMYGPVEAQHAKLGWAAEQLRLAEREAASEGAVRYYTEYIAKETEVLKALQAETQPKPEGN